MGLVVYFTISSRRLVVLSYFIARGETLYTGNFARDLSALVRDVDGTPLSGFARQRKG